MKRRYFKAKKEKGVMNGTEEWYYSSVLKPRILSGEVESIEYEALTFKLGDGSRYTPDFYVVRTDGGAELHETKGYWREDDRVKIKVAASKYKEFYWYGIRIGKVKRQYTILKLEEF